jgi:tetratricopeptide (TPR) repeat protein
MPDRQQLIMLLELAADEERRFAASLTPAQRAAAGSLDRPSPKDRLAHVAGAKEALSEALAAAREGREQPASHDREALLEASAARSFESVHEDADRVHRELVAEVERLDAAALASSPAWIGEETVADEIVQQAVTHSLAHVLGADSARGNAAAAVAAQERFVAALPDDLSIRQRTRALYNLGCLYAGAGRDDDALRSLKKAAAERPELYEHARTDPDLASLRPRLT